MKTNANHTNANARANTPAPADTANANARTSYDFANDHNDGFDALRKFNRNGAAAFMAVTLPDFVASFKGTDLAITSADFVETVNKKTGKKSFKVVIMPANLPNSHGIHITCNTTASLDMVKVGRKYANKWAALDAKNRAANTPEALADKELKRKVSALKRAVKAYRRSLLKCSAIDETCATNFATVFALDQYAQLAKTHDGAAAYKDDICAAAA